MQTILITGVAGFIGSHLAEHLLARGDMVIGLDNFDEYYDPAIKERNLSMLAEKDTFSLVRGDILDQPLLDRIIKEQGVNSVIHLAARAGVRPSIDKPLDYQRVNLQGTMTVLEACRSAGIGKMVFGSSSSVYGSQTKVPFAEDDPVANPVSPYAATKRAGELFCHTYYHLFGMNISCLRYFTVYGPRQRPDMAIHKFSRAILKGEAISVFGDGSSIRDYTYVDDIVMGTIAALDRVEGYKIYNIGGARSISLNELIELLERHLGRKAIIDRKGDQPGDVPRTQADVSLAMKELNYNPTVDVQEGISRFAAWIKEEAVS